MVSVWPVLFRILFVFNLACVAHAGEIQKVGDQYVARGLAFADDDVLSLQKACLDARRTLIGSVFGEIVQINQTTVRSFGSIDFSEDAHVASEKVQLVGWTQEIFNDGRNITCEIRYPVKESMIEKERLKGEIKKEHIQYTEMGDDTGDLSGSLEIATFPGNATVYIDHLRWGTTPLRLKNKLPVGEHLVRIELDKFDPIEERVVIKPGGKVQIIRKLNRAMATLSIKSDPSGAQVYVNDQIWGTTPLKTTRVLAGQEMRVQIYHPLAEKYVEKMTLERNEKKDLDIALALKPGYLSFNVHPSDGLAVSVDGELLASWAKIKLSPGVHTLRIAKDGFETFQQDIRIEAKKNTVLSTIELQRARELPSAVQEIDSIIGATSAEAGEFILEDPIVEHNLSVGLHFYGSNFEVLQAGTAMLHAEYEYLFFPFLGLAGSVASGETTIIYQNAKLRIQATDLGVGMYIHFLQNEEWAMSVGGGSSLIQTTYSLSDAPGNEAIKVKQIADSWLIRVRRKIASSDSNLSFAVTYGFANVHDADVGLKGRKSSRLGLDLLWGF